jgi:hypothetical protein
MEDDGRWLLEISLLSSRLLSRPPASTVSISWRPCSTKANPLFSFYVHGFTILDRSRNHRCFQFRPHARCRTCPSRIANDSYIDVQHTLVLGSKSNISTIQHISQLTVLVHHRSMDNIRYIPYQLRMVMASPHCSSSTPRHHQPRWSLVSSREFSMACWSGSP